MTTQPKCETSIPLALLNISLRQLLLRLLLVTSSDLQDSKVLTRQKETICTRGQQHAI